MEKTSHCNRGTLFKNEPRYKPPATGILSLFSDRWRPYAELARLDKPGFALLWIVHFGGVLQASIINGLAVRDVVALGAYFLPACQALMLFNFAWNDTCDVDFDRQVLRTRHRPLARDALTRGQALAFDGLLACTLLSFLIPLSLSCTVYAVVLGFGCLVYPLTKRCTNYPQVCLGFILAGGVYIGAAAAGVAGLPFPSKVQDILSPRTWPVPPRNTMFASCCQYLTVFTWVVSTETIYSYQDAEWDEDAGVGTITRLIPDYKAAKLFLFLLAAIQVCLFIWTGIALELNSSLWITSICMTAASLVFTIVNVDLKSPSSCSSWFQAGNLATGCAMLFGYAAEYMLKMRFREIE